jgi:hypothetical protein
MSAETPEEEQKEKAPKKLLPAVIPTHVAYPHTFVSQQTYERGSEPEADWEVLSSESELDLNGQLRQFVDRTGSVVTQISPPNVSVYSENDNRRVLITSVSLLYIPATEGINDRPRKVDADPTDPSVELGDIHREPVPSVPATAGTGDGGPSSA